MQVKITTEQQVLHDSLTETTVWASRTLEDNIKIMTGPLLYDCCDTLFDQL